MIEKEAINVMTQAKEEAGQAFLGKVQFNVPQYHAVIKALEKQIPKKPLDICTPVVTWGLCPVCKGELNKLGGHPNRVFEGTEYCTDCGQKLLWEEEEC